MSAIGTKRTSACALQMSAFDPKRTLCSEALLDYGLLLMWGSSCRTTFSNERWISI